MTSISPEVEIDSNNDDDEPIGLMPDIIEKDYSKIPTAHRQKTTVSTQKADKIKRAYNIM